MEQRPRLFPSSVIRGGPGLAQVHGKPKITALPLNAVHANFTTHQLQNVLDGNLDELIDALTTHYTAEKLREATQSPA